MYMISRRLKPAQSSLKIIKNYWRSVSWGNLVLVGLRRWTSFHLGSTWSSLAAPDWPTLQRSWGDVGWIIGIKQETLMKWREIWSLIIGWSWCVLSLVDAIFATYLKCVQACMHKGTAPLSTCSDKPEKQLEAAIHWKQLDSDTVEPTIMQGLRRGTVSDTTDKITSAPSLLRRSICAWHLPQAQ